ncbi:polysaccharide pyruvyl transferase family protein [Rhodobacteraceae bacterium CCMM004]|nr:polysaccharide pyruvyl transferase family protein [Rhodobacteraceae bacterium CCMM004]
MKIVQFGLHYSPNVGDGIIAECLAHGLRAAAPGVEVRTVDISGRDGFGAVTVRNRGAVLKVLAALPRPLRLALIRRRLGALLDRVVPDWTQALDGADLAVIGGGQILSDADLNFPLKLSRVAGVLAQSGTPAAIHAAGVSRNWSPEGAALFADLFDTDLRAVGLRDAPSRDAWIAQTGGRGPAPHLTRDPGLLAAACYGPVPEGARLGLGVAAPEILGYHAERGVAGGGAPDFFAALATALAEHAPVTLFTNGAAEDRAALARLLQHPDLAAPLASGRIDRAPDPDTPADLAATIAPLRGVVAHRLHALIVAYAYGRVPFGLGWDAKVESFCRSVDLDHAFAGADAGTPGDIAAAAVAALAAGIDPARHRAVLDETQASLAALLTHAAGA